MRYLLFFAIVLFFLSCDSGETTFSSEQFDCDSCKTWEQCNETNSECILAENKCDSHDDCSDVIDNRTTCGGDDAHSCINPDQFKCEQCASWQICNENRTSCLTKEGFCSYNNECIINNLTKCNLDTHLCEAAPFDCNSCENWQECNSDNTACVTASGYCSNSLECTTGDTTECNTTTHICDTPITGNEPAFAVTGTQYSIGNTSPGESYMLELINRARSNPTKEGKFLTHSGDSNIESAINYFASDYSATLAIIESAFESYNATPPLAFNQKLNAAALVATKLQRDNDVQAHVIGNSDPGTRITDAGYQWRAYGENAFASSDYELYAHCAFNIDWGGGANGLQDSLGHRKSIMGLNNYDINEIGISVLTEDIPTSNKNAKGPQIITQDFAHQQKNSNNYITGVIYDDTNSNRFYDIGEGISGITISVDGGDAYAVSNNSGAYTIPISGTKTITIQAFGDTFTTQTATANLNDENYKLDFNQQKTGANGDASVGFDFLSLKKSFQASPSIQIPGEPL